jgi:mannitol 2-dehydrogenase
LWARYCYGTTDSGKPIAPNDPNWDRLTAQARRAKEEPKAWLEMRDIFGPLSDDPAYVEAFTTALASIWKLGTKQALTRYLAGDH